MRKRWIGIVLLILGGMAALGFFAVVWVVRLAVLNQVGQRHFQIAVGAMNRMEYDAAIHEFTTALRYPLGNSWRATALGDRGFCEARAGNDRQAAAMTDLTAALGLNSKLAFVYTERAALRAGWWDERGAVDDCARALALDPNQAQAFYTRAGISFRRQQWDRAIADFSETIRCWPNYASAYTERALAFEGKGDLEQASASFDSAVQVAPDSEAPFFYRGYFRHRHGQLDQAIADFSAALRISPNSIRAHEGRAQTYVAKRDHQKATVDWSSILLLQPRNEWALENRGRSYREIGELEKAIADFSELIRITQQSRGYDLRARAYTSAGKYQEALADYRTGWPLKSKITPSAKAMPWLLATCPDASIRDGAEALKRATQDCERSKWDNWSCLDTLAAAYAETGDFAKAIEYEKQALTFENVAAKPRAAMENRMALYKSGRQFRETPGK